MNEVIIEFVQQYVEQNQSSPPQDKWGCSVTKIPESYSTTKSDYFSSLESIRLQFTQQQVNTTAIAQVTTSVSQLTLKVEQLTKDVSTLTKIVMLFIQNAETYREVFQVKSRRVWAYLLQQQLNGRDKK